MDKSPRVDRKALRSPDQFVKWGQQVLAAAWRKRRRAVPVLAAILVALVMVYGWGLWSDQKTQKGWRAYNTALKSTGDKKFEDLKGVHNAFRRTRPGYFAALNVADHYFEEAKKDSLKSGAIPAGANEALDWYRKGSNFGSLLPTERQLVHVNIGNTLELLQKYDDAFGEYKKAADIKGEAKALALLNLGRIYELKGDATKASETYERISQDFLNTEYSKLAKNYLRRLKSPLFQTGKNG